MADGPHQVADARRRAGCAVEAAKIVVRAAATAVETVRAGDVRLIGKVPGSPIIARKQDGESLLRARDAPAGGWASPPLLPANACVPMLSYRPGVLLMTWLGSQGLIMALKLPVEGMAWKDGASTTCCLAIRLVDCVALMETVPLPPVPTLLPALIYPASVVPEGTVPVLMLITSSQDGQSWTE